MSNSELYTKCLNADFEAIFKSKGYAFFTKGDYNLNIIGVRADKKCKVTNQYDDYIVVDYYTSVSHKRAIWSITTEPGLYYMKHMTNGKGTAILVPGQYRGAYKIDLHRGKYKALCQRNKVVKVYRDANKDNVYDLLPETIDTGMFGINIHRSHESIKTLTIDKYSAGCQVFDNPKDFTSFMKLCEEQRKRYGNKFTYTLIDEKDLL